MAVGGARAEHYHCYSSGRRACVLLGVHRRFLLYRLLLFAEEACDSSHRRCATGDGCAMGSDTSERSIADVLPADGVRSAAISRASALPTEQMMTLMGTMCRAAAAVEKNICNVLPEITNINELK